MRAQRALSRQSTTTNVLKEEAKKPKVAVQILGQDGKVLMNHAERQKKIADWDKWVKQHFEEIQTALKNANATH